jgi:hypothetical protein
LNPDPIRIRIRNTDCIETVVQIPEAELLSPATWGTSQESAGMLATSPPDLKYSQRIDYLKQILNVIFHNYFQNVKHGKGLAVGDLLLLFLTSLQIFVHIGEKRVHK